MYATKKTMLEVAIRSELLTLQKNTSRSARERRDIWRRRSAEQAAQVAVNSETKDQEERLLKAKMEETWDLSDHPKKEQIWAISKDLGYQQGLSYVEDIYCQLIPLIIPNP